MEDDAQNVRIQKQKKIYFIVEKFKEIHSKLETDIQNRIPLEYLITMSNVLVEDEHIFEVIGKLNELQNATEDVLKKQRDEMVLENQREIEEYVQKLNDSSEIAHTIQLLRKQHAIKLKELDKAIVQNLDCLVLEQQNTLQILNLPAFTETLTDSKAIIVQMHLLSMILKLQKMLANQNFS